MTFAEHLASAAGEFGLTLSVQQQASFDRYNSLLLAWNEKINLTAITEPREVAVKHIIDSLACLDPAFFPAGATVIDVGTGAGLPGIPLKIVRPDLALTLLDSLNKRLVFLQDVIDQLGLAGVRLVHARAEEGGRQADLRESHQVAVSRAVARLNVLCELCLPFVKVGGYFVALKGAQHKEELGEAEKALKALGGRVASVKQVRLPGLDDQRAVIYIEKVAKTPAAYPRRPGLPEKKPL